MINELSYINISMKKGNDSESRRIKVVSDYFGFDFFLVKQPLKCTLKIPETVMLDRNGAPKEWIFNSSRLGNVILKKRKENLLPLSIAKSICLKYLPSNLLTPIKTISELRDIAKAALQQQKDAEFTSRKKHVQIRTVDDELLQMSLTQFLDMIGGNKLAEQSFYEKWRMIQQRVSTRKHDESYLVQSQRKNHLIESKCSKHIQLAQVQNSSYIDTIPSTQLQADSKSEDYKFFDSYLNKKFFTAVQQLVECIEKNYKCIVQNITTRFVIDYNRQPHLTEVQQVYVKPSRKLYEMRQFAQSINSGEIKIQNYSKCLLQYLFQNPAKVEPTLDQPLHQFKRHRCRGQFCNATILSIPHLPQPRLKLPIIGSNIRRMAVSLIEATKKRKGRVIERLKEKGVISIDYVPQDSQSSEFDDSELEETQQNVRVCQTCFVFYLNVLKFFEIDSFGGLNDRKIIASNTIEKKKEEVLDTQNINLKKVKEKPANIIKRSASQATKLRPIPQTSRSKNNSLDRSLSTPRIQKAKLSELYKKIEKIKPSEPKKINPLTSQLAAVVEQTTNKMIQLKINNVKVLPNEITKPQIKSPKKGLDCKPTNFYQASEQLLHKLQFVPRSSRQQFIVFCKKYYKDKPVQKVDRTAFSSEYLSHLYEFMNNSTLVLAPNNLINGRPEMTLKRLSALTGYPQIVSKSAFIFEALICDEKTTIPFCVISSEMVHSNNNPKRPYHNIFLINDIFDSFIEFIATAKELLEETSNCRIIMFNYPGQSHTIYDANSPFRPAQFNSIVDKIIFKLAQPGKGCIIGSADKFKFIGFGFGGYLASCFLSATFALGSLTDGVFLVNTASNCSVKCRNIFTTLLELYQAQDKPTANNAFLIYNKAIKSPEIGKEDLQNKGGLNSIRLDGRAYLLKNALKYWQEEANQYFADYEGQVALLHGRSNAFIAKTEMQDFLHRRNAERTVISNRAIVQVNGGHDLAAQNYDEFIKSVGKFIG